MLEGIKAAISELPFISFEEYFQNYVMNVQDSNISYEVSFFIRNNFVDVLTLDKVISDLHREMEQ